MPVLTTHKEPEDYQPSDPDDPNEYAIRYLFNRERDNARDLKITGKAMVLFGTIGSIIAFGIMIGNLEFNVDWLLLGWSISTILLHFGALQRVRTKIGWDWTIPLPLTSVLIAFLTILLLSLPGNSPLMYMLYFLPGSATTLLGGFFLRLHRNT